MKPFTVVPLTLLLCASAGCASDKPIDAEPSEPERLAEPRPAVLTSTHVPKSPSLPSLPDLPEPPAKVEEHETNDESAKPGVPVSFEPVLDDVGGLQIQRLITTPAVDGREPTDPRSVFDHDHDKVIAFIEASNDTSDPKSLFVHFVGPSGAVTGGVELVIPAHAPRWRTWAFTRFAKEEGVWHVEVRDADGVLIGTLPFEVEPDC